MSAYYNEIDPFAAAWLRELIDAGHIAPGIVDTRSIEDVTPNDLRGFTQCHFFAGIGVWSYALRRAGWPDDRPVWTGSCPCQPFSSAGQGAGFADERHLWPTFHHLIRVCRPPVVVGEQVASKDADPWVDLVCADMEALGYAFGAVPFPSAGVGAPHIRDRLYWLADSASNRWVGQGSSPEVQTGRDTRPEQSGLLAGGLERRPILDDGKTAGMEPDRLDNANDARLEGLRSGYKTEGGRFGEVRPIAAGCPPSGLAHAADERLHGRRASGPCDGRDTARIESERLCDAGIDYRPGPTNGLWSDADWLLCRDGRWRPVEPGTFPLAHGAPARVGRLRGYGNAINAEAAIAFIEATGLC